MEFLKGKWFCALLVLALILVLDVNPYAGGLLV